MSSTNGERSRVLLQEELTRFKRGRSSVTLSKANGSRAPFPITVGFVIETPSTFKYYDVEAIGVQVVIDEARVGVNDASCSVFSSLVHVTDAPSSPLPVSLRDKMAVKLQKFLDDYKGHGSPGSGMGEGAPIGLASLAKHVETNFGALVSSDPKLLETYLVSDPVTKRSERRVAILREDVEVAIDVSVDAGSQKATRAVDKYLERLEADSAALSRIHGADSVSCTVTGATFIKAKEEENAVVEFLHRHGVGTSLKQFSSASHVLTVTAIPTSPEWMRAVPVDAGNTAPIPLRIRVFVGGGYPSKSDILCRVQLDDSQGMVPVEYDRMLLVFEKLLLLKATGGGMESSATEEQSAKAGSLLAKDIVKDCLNHADEAMRDALAMYEEAVATAEAKRKAAEQECQTSPTTSPRLRGRHEPQSSADKYVAVLHNLQMDGIDALSLHSVAMEVLCSRCHKAHLVTKDSLDTRWTLIETACSACHSELSIAIQPRIIHASCNTIGIVATTGCKPLDFLPSCSFEVQCDCTSTRVMRNQFHQGRWNEESCRTCHLKNSFVFERCVFQDLGARGAGKGRAPGRACGSLHGSSPNMPNIYDADTPLLKGQPLPNTGTCVHYRHSHRWLRFPCCGRRFPCDLCHEQHTDGHEMKWAKSMACGFCSLEQRVDSKCTGCGKKLATSASNPNGRRTRFWEGGEGQRDKTRLSRRDVHKYRNSKAKTVSKKAFAAKSAKKTAS